MRARQNSGNCDNRGRDGQPTGGVQVSTVSFQTGAMAVTIVAGADAIGGDTLATVDTVISVADRGLLTYAGGMSSATAAALSSDNGAYASSYAELAVSGADYMSVGIQRIEGMAADRSSAVASIHLGFFAVDLKWLDLEEGGVAETVVPMSGVPNISGNLATFTAALSAEGENSFTELTTDALAIEDHLSSTVMQATAAIDATITYLRYVGTTRADKIYTGNDDALVEAGRGDDQVTTGRGADWVFAGDGNDQVNSGTGDDTVFGGVGNDKLKGADGNDWLFGGRSDDTMEGGEGDDLIFGGDGKDTIDGGSGADLINAGAGRDTVRGGGGDDIFWLGAEHGDSDDRYWGGSGADIYLITGEFDTDVIMDFSLAAGDRLVVTIGDWDSAEALNLLNGTTVNLQRARGDADDLVITFNGPMRGELVLDEFFALNPGYSGLPARGAFSDAAALPLLGALFGDDAGVLTDDRQMLFQLGFYLGEVG